MYLMNYAPVAQLDRVGGFEPLGREFESLRVRQTKRINSCFTRVFCFIALVKNCELPFELPFVSISPGAPI